MGSRKHVGGSLEFQDHGATLTGPGGTHITLTHSGFENACADLREEIHQDFRRGWADHELERLKQVFGGREGVAYRKLGRGAGGSLGEHPV